MQTLLLIVLAGALLPNPAMPNPAMLNPAMPNLKITPGVVRTTDTKLVCSGGSTRQFRHTTPAMKVKVYKAYGRTKKAGVCCEVDHLLPLELGGADDVRNLWPQPFLPAPGAHEKDKVENYLHKQVCSGKMKLQDAQQAIIHNWWAVYKSMPRSEQ